MSQSIHVMVWAIQKAYRVRDTAEGQEPDTLVKNSQAVLEARDTLYTYVKANPEAAAKVAMSQGLTAEQRGYIVEALLVTSDPEDKLDIIGRLYLALADRLSAGTDVQAVNGEPVPVDSLIAAAKPRPPLPET